MNATSVVLERVVKKYGDLEVVHGIDLNIDPGEFTVFVGPSGCGKSTLLRMIAGLEPITGGQLLIDGQRMNEVPAAGRGIAMVFQSYALYPHMSVYQNLAFGLETARMPRAEIAKRVDKAAQILKIEPLLKRKPRQLSGGQRQRVAIGRAIVREPRIFLFDEPLSNLDAELRVQMRVEIAKLHNDLGNTMIYVTHDQVLNDVPAAKRGIAMVFQSYALYPHMSVYQNLAFGLETARLPKPEIEQRVQRAAGILQIEPLLNLGLRHPRRFQPEGQVLVHRHVRVERVALEHHGDAALGRRHLIHPRAVDHQVTARNRLEAGDHPQQRRLPAARRSDEHRELTRLDVEVDAVDHFHVAVALHRLVEDDARCHQRNSSGSQLPYFGCVGPTGNDTSCRVSLE